jgi:Glu-tRNA(Gln) amidotransferase subunit E-like FAD-binding protein
VQTKLSKFTKKAIASATIEKCGPAAPVTLQKQRMDVSKLTMQEIRALFHFCFETEIRKGNIEMVCVNLPYSLRSQRVWCLSYLLFACTTSDHRS